ncbi:MAG: hypothetical protein ABI870_02745 [Rhodanobacter sp.]
MNRKMLAVLIAALVGWGTASHTSMASAANAPQYFVVNLPSLGGINSEGNSINEFGLISGFSDTAGTTGDLHTLATAWVFGQKINLKTLGGANSSVVWPVKNGFSVISGISQTDKTDPNHESWSCSAFFYGTDTGAGSTCLGFVWAFGKMTSLSPLPGGNNSFATGTNNRLQTVGWAENGVHDSSCNIHHDSDQVLQFLPVVWGPEPHHIQTLPLLRGDSSGAATAINDRGQIVGISGLCDQAVGRETARHMVLWQNGHATDLGNIGGNAWNTPMAINQQGDIVGFANTAPGDGFSLHAFYRSHAGGSPIDLGVLYPGDSVSQALGINDRGQVVGLSCGANGCNGFLWQNGVMLDLNKVVPGYDGVIEDAQDINDLGQITGQAADTAGNLVSFWATPMAGHGSHGSAASGAPPKTALSPKAKQELMQRLGLGRIDLATGSIRH